MFDHLTPELVISSLRLLLETYKLGRDRFKDRKAPEDIEKIVIRAEKSEPKTLNSADIDRSITEALTPEDAAMVKGDLQLLSLLLLPAPKLDAFDYWGMLSRLVAGLQTFAAEKRLFELRGNKRFDLGQYLPLSKTSTCILPKDLAVKLATPYQRESVKDAEGVAILLQGGSGFPIWMGVTARFNEYYSMGGPPGVKADTCFFEIRPGQQRHWLMFNRGHRSTGHFVQSFEYMLEASDFVSIVKALRDDIHDYATAINADEQKIGLLSAAIDAFVQANTKRTP